MTGFAGPLPAVTFQWSVITWPDGTFQNEYDIDASNPGNDIRITINAASDSGYIAPSPNVFPIGNTFAFTGGIGGTGNPATAASQNLDVFMNRGSNLDFSTISVEFLYADGVTDVSWTVFDVDSSATQNGDGTLAYRDQIRNIQGINSNTAQTFFGPTVNITNSTFTEQTGSGAGLTVQGINSPVTADNQSDEGTVDFDFGTTEVTSIQFDYGNATNTPDDPAQQGIGLHDISYTPVPEPSSAMLVLAGGAFFCGGGATVEVRVGMDGIPFSPFAGSRVASAHVLRAS